MEHLKLIQDATRLLLFLECAPIDIDAGCCPRCHKREDHADDCELIRVLEQLSEICIANEPMPTEDQIRRRKELKQACDEQMAELDRILHQEDDATRMNQDLQQLPDTFVMTQARFTQLAAAYDLIREITHRTPNLDIELYAEDNAIDAKAVAEDLAKKGKRVELSLTAEEQAELDKNCLRANDSRFDPEIIDNAQPAPI